ncbi:Maf family protein [Pseudoclavibacter alba]|uniref:Maf family protein n=1 Tax=Pseudoclavibacter albus TaxID=272241 RepID=UPI0019D2E4F6|nr:nucleoside triphosphate pyrophosphatase [Pseudoclavibacter alba]MBN6778314.1 Maf family protein [Pseudoclavibacter alba]
MRVYLASTSPARLMLLRSSGIEPIAIPSQVDEDAALERVAAARGVQVSDLSPETVVLELARTKAEAVAGAAVDPVNGGELDGLVIGGDSMFEIDGRVLGKPYAPDVARERWLAQLGKTGTLWSGHWVVDCRRASHARDDVDEARGLGRVASAHVTFVEGLSEAELEAYIASGEPLHVAGAFTIDSLAAPFIERVDGDPSTVVGMSLPTLRCMVRELGIEWHELWNRVPEHRA